MVFCMCMRGVVKDARVHCMQKPKDPTLDDLSNSEKMHRLQKSILLN